MENVTTNSPTASAILNILQQISISPPHSHIQHHRSASKKVLPKRRLSSSSFDGHQSHIDKRQITYQRRNKKFSYNNTTQNLPVPLSHSQLLFRINTFSILTWSITSSVLSPLLCATQGWICHSKRKNELLCTACHAVIMIQLPAHNQTNREGNPLDFSPNNVPDLFLYSYQNKDKETDGQLYETLLLSYGRRLLTEHYPTCPFVPLLPLSPNDQNYYYTSKDIPREITGLYDRLIVLNSHRKLLLGRNFDKSILTTAESSYFRSYLNNVLSDFMLDAGEKVSLDVGLPALLGWDLKLQKFHKDTILLLRCSCCTRRILLDEHTEEKNGLHMLEHCPYPADFPTKDELTEFETEKIDEYEDKINLVEEHEDWCCVKQGWKLVFRGLRASLDTEIALEENSMDSEASFACTMKHLKTI